MKRNKEDTYIKKGFSKWKKAPKCFQDHQLSKCHETALTFEITIPKCGDVLEMSDSAVVKKRQEESKYFLKIMECVQYLALQGLAFRGDVAVEENFTQLMLLRCKDYPELTKRILNEKIITDPNVPVEKKYLHQDF